jgi:hypothetical protein
VVAVVLFAQAYFFWDAAESVLHQLLAALTAIGGLIAAVGAILDARMAKLATKLEELPRRIAAELATIPASSPPATAPPAISVRAGPAPAKTDSYIAKLRASPDDRPEWS